MNTQNITFYNPAFRLLKQLQLKIVALGPFLYAKSLFSDGNEFMKFGLIEEAAQFSTSGHRNARMTAAEHPYLKHFSQIVGGNRMVPIFLISVIATILVAADPVLRSLFNQRHLGADTPNFVNSIFASIRGTERRGITATLTAAFNTIILKHFNLENTIFDVTHVATDVNKQDFLFSLILGTLLPSYQIKSEPFKVISYNTNHFTVSSIVFRYVNNTFNMFINPISTIKSIDNMFDPTIVEAYMSYFCGITCATIDDKELDLGSYYTYFEVSINKSNYFPILLSFFVERRSGYVNPATIRNSERKSLNSNSNGSPSDIAMASIASDKQQITNDHNVSELKLSYEYLKFLNNIFEVSKPTFFKILRKDGLINQLPTVFKKINLTTKFLNVHKPTGLL